VCPLTDEFDNEMSVMLTLPFSSITDTTVTAGLGLRWALTGPFMTNILGGGGGKTGFKHLLEHLAPAAEGWTKDMNKHSFVYNSENINQLDASVQDWLAVVDSSAVEAQRDEILLALIRLKEQTTLI
jgi:3-hydroxyacyl-CoA dehydrogenase